MDILRFEGVNVVYAENQPEYLQLPAYKREDGEVTCCFSLSLKEKIKVLLTGRIWISILTFNKPLQPILVSVNKPIDIKGSNE